MKKTIEEWYNELPEPYKTQALFNLNPDTSKDIEDSIVVALLSGFLWISSPQGNEYWEDFTTKIEDGTITINSNSGEHTTAV